MLISRLFLCLLILTGFVANAQSELVTLGNLESEIDETSGLIDFNGRLITHNDSGNSPELFELDTLTGTVLRTVIVTNAENGDWEDLDQDEDYIYIGDFGNNNGNRRDLGFYRIDKDAYINSTVVSAERIGFFYEDQQDFMSNTNSDWDAEAFFVLDDSLIVLTKQWQQMGTVAYKIPKDIGNHMAVRMDDYQLDGLVTGAAYDELEDILVLVGYSSLLFPFIVTVSGVSSVAIFSGAITKSTLEIGIAQIEAVCNIGNTYYMTSEAYMNDALQISSPARLFSFMLGEESITDDRLVLFQPPNSTEIHYVLDTDDDVFGQAIFDTSGRAMYYNPIEIFKQGSVDVSFLRPSIYFLSFYIRGGKITKPFVINQ